jgi:glycosyltransferase involved in cell wall biosynthesis
MHVLMLSSEYPPRFVGGLGTHVLELTKGLVREGCRVTVLSPSEDEPDTLHEPNLSVHWFSMRDCLSLGSLLQVVNASNDTCFRYALNLLAGEKEQPSVIHCHDWLSFPAAQKLGRLLGVPVVATMHLLYSPTNYWTGEEVDSNIEQVEREMCRQGAALIAVSRAMKDLTASHYGVPGEKITVVYNGMDTRHFLEAAEKTAEVARLRRALAPNGEKLIIFAGRLVPQKGIPALLESASQVFARFPRARYLIAGTVPGMPASELPRFFSERYPQRSEVWDKVKFLGMRPRQELALLYQAADVAVVPSLYEPFGYAAVEAMTAGLPVVASAVGGLPEVVIDGETGLLVPVHGGGKGVNRVDAGKLAEAQLFLLDNGPAAKQMGEAGKRRALREFNRERMAESVMKVYSNLVAGRTSHPNEATEVLG